MIPLKDENPTSRRAVVTFGLVLACAGMWFLVQEGQEDSRDIDVDGRQVQVQGDLAFNLEWAAVPCEVIDQEPLNLTEVRDTFQGGDDEACGAEIEGGTAELFPDKSIWLSVLVSMFLHGSLLHLGGNLLYLWIFGNNVEDRLGPVAYLSFYLVGGVVATLAHVAVNPDSTVPTPTARSPEPAGGTSASCSPASRHGWTCRSTPRPTASPTTSPASSLSCSSRGCRAPGGRDGPCAAGAPGRRASRRRRRTRSRRRGPSRRPRCRCR